MRFIHTNKPHIKRYLSLSKEIFGKKGCSIILEALFISRFFFTF